MLPPTRRQGRPRLRRARRWSSSCSGSCQCAWRPAPAARPARRVRCGGCSWHLMRVDVRPSSGGSSTGLHAGGSTVSSARPGIVKSVRHVGVLKIESLRPLPAVTTIVDGHERRPSDPIVRGDDLDRVAIVDVAERSASKLAASPEVSSADSSGDAGSERRSAAASATSVRGRGPSSRRGVDPVRTRLRLPAASRRRMRQRKAPPPDERVSYRGRQASRASARSR